MWDVTIHPFKGPMFSSAPSSPGIDSDAKLSYPRLGPRHILGSTPPNSHENFPVGHLSWDCPHMNRLNFGVPMEPEASELLRGLMLGRDGNIHMIHSPRRCVILKCIFSSLSSTRPFGSSLASGSVGTPKLSENEARAFPGWVTYWEVTREFLKNKTVREWAQRPRQHTLGQGLALIPNCHILALAPTTSRARLCRSTILSALGPDHAFTVLFNFPVNHLSWDCSRVNTLNFRVPMEPEASELPKGLVLGRKGNIHIRLTRSTPRGDVGCYNRPLLEARLPMEPEASELPKDLVIGRDENIHIRLT
ncbi:hypothetical protein DVH24_023374 [Malus domestica]|uniref:Uncharacterized protein n=1 Tax=Malus domestica TaxID=3750 RepID=A0A498KWA1_MALDO|nr:hypothetical protein DVH24_023374 [Malus domestica]